MLHPAPRSPEQPTTLGFDVHEAASVITVAREQAAHGLDLPDFKDRSLIAANEYATAKASEIPAAKLDASIGDPNGDTTSESQAVDELRVVAKDSAPETLSIDAAIADSESEQVSEPSKESWLDRTKEMIFTRKDKHELAAELSKEVYQPKHRRDRDEMDYKPYVVKDDLQVDTAPAPETVNSAQEQTLELEAVPERYEAEDNTDALDEYQKDWIDRAQDAINGKLTKLYYGIGNTINRFTSKDRKDGETNDEYSERMQRNGRRVAIGITAVAAAYGAYRAYSLYQGMSGAGQVDISTLSTEEIMEKIEKSNGPSGVYPDPSLVTAGDTLTAEPTGSIPEAVTVDLSATPAVGGYSPTETGLSSSIDSDAWNIPSGSGGEALMDRLGVDKIVWTQHQDEFLSKFPNEAYRMPDGNVGISNTGRLSKEAIEFWAEYTK